MTLDVKTCLICDDVAVIEVLSLKLQRAPLCGVHWADYCESEASLTSDEVRKFFDDGSPGDEPDSIPVAVEMWNEEKRTDEEPGEYRTDEQERR
ncbi:MAG: hypothetical protein DCC56_02920 [Anaerolineae bacterium]|nr:MAG: hypothetical protein DCC56_02920 [Anaerolineae bacterium]WKZ44211.1 MAG: hypothetical protein QY302_00300 [Anaerolineales bacterium]